MRNYWRLQIKPNRPISVQLVNDSKKGRTGIFCKQPYVFCTYSLAVWRTHYSQLNLNLANLEATLEAEWFLAFLFVLAKAASFNDVAITSSLRSVVQVLMKLFIICQSPRMSGQFVLKLWKVAYICQSYDQLSCIMWQSSLAACGHMGVATQASGVLFVTRRARAVAACACRLSQSSVISWWRRTRLNLSV